ncbi:type IV secretory system conjugative DNA transfer family protein, partial [Mycoplasmopsis bovis]|uniref:type IV secretory system conjugative DNA transfer family protein n=1 Tax=Mycoplasmopsis bovis TaxID=28903 RepID=UPI003D2BD72C
MACLIQKYLRLKYKSSFVITDPKKEIIKAVGKKLTDQNYKIFAIDFSEPEYSNGCYIVCLVKLLFVFY